MAKLVRILALMLLPAAAAALDVPRLESRVTDLAGILNPEESQGLEGRLRDLETSDSTQIAVLIIPSLEGEVLEDYSERVASAWRLGQKGRDNGALLLVAMRERRLRIEVGYGLEPTLTDAKSRQIIQNEILPYFREGRYFEGVNAGVGAMISVVRGTYTGTGVPRGRQRSEARRPFDWLILMLAPALWLLRVLGRLGGGLIGAGAGAYMAYAVAGALPIPLAIGGLVGGILGFAVAGAIGSGGGRPPRVGGGPFIFPGGGFSSRGGFSSGGGFSIGGFSGGGGGFGGGGSSGRW